MHRRSLAVATDLFILRLGGAQVIERDGYTVVRSPAQPTFYYGNFLLFPAAPAPGDFERWMDLCRAEFADDPEVRHETFCWDDPQGRTGDSRPFIDAGFECDTSAVMVASGTHLPPHPLHELRVRPLAGDADWDGARACLASARDEKHEEASHDTFLLRSMRARRAMVESGAGQWFGAFLDGVIVGTLGIFVEDGVGRFQSVVVSPAARRRGVCGTLVHAAARHALSELGAERLVMVADPDDDAIRVYRSVGFSAAEQQASLYRFPRD
jgi:ribosomal protein S18 acetylase RimI-like enzyme